MKRLYCSLFAFGAACTNSERAVTGPAGAAGSPGVAGSAGAPGATGAVSTAPPAAPAVAYLAASASGAPHYALHWTAPNDGSIISAYKIYDATESVAAAPTAPATLSVVSGSATSTDVLVPVDSGAQFFRVSAVSAAGVEGAASAEVEIDPSAELFFLANNAEFSRVAGTGAGTLPGSIPETTFGSSDSLLNFAPSPDGKNVAFLTTATPAPLFIAATDGIAGTRVPTPVVAGSFGVVGMGWSPDASKLAFVADETVAGTLELYVTAPGAATPTKISPVLPSNGIVTAYAWSPDGQHVAMLASLNSRNDLHLFVSALDTNPAVQVDQPLVARAATTITAVAWAPDSRSLLYSTSDGDLGLIALGAATPRLVFGGLRQSYFALSPDGASVLALAANGPKNEVWLGPSAGGVFTRLSADVVTALGWSPDGSAVSFIDTLNNTLVVMSGADSVNIATGVSYFYWSPTSSALAFVGSNGDLFVSSRDGATIVNVSNFPGGNTTKSIGATTWSPAGDMLAWAYYDGATYSAFISTFAADGIANDPIGVSNDLFWRSPGFGSCAMQTYD